MRLLKHKFLRDTATLQVGTLFNALGNASSTLALAYLLGAAKQGALIFSISLYSLLWFLMNQGVVSATVSQVAAANARGIPEKAGAWLAFLAKAYIAIGLVLAAAGWFFLPSLAKALNSDPETATWAWWLCWTPLLELPRVVACAALQGTRRMLPLAQIENTQEASRVFLVVVGAIVTGSAAGAVLGTLASSLIGSIVAAELYRSARAAGDVALPSARDIARQVRDVPLAAGFPLGIKMGLVRSIDALNVKVIPPLLLQTFASSEWVAYLRIGQTIMGLPLMFMQGLSRTTLPVLSELAGLKDMQRFKRTFVRASLLSGAFISTGLLVSLVCVPWVLRLLPESYRDPTWKVCLILVPGMVVMSFSIANDTFYLVTNTLKAGVVLCVVGLVVNCLVLALLGWLYPHYGIAWGLSFTMASASMHYVYAAWWFRQRSVADARPAPDVGSAH
jgi:O-antigen/teichoic acid export membrane protein